MRPEELPHSPKERADILTSEVKELVQAYRAASDEEHRQNTVLDETDIEADAIGPRKVIEKSVIVARLKELIGRFEKIVENKGKEDDQKAA